jgi:hypothetical protein
MKVIRTQLIVLFVVSITMISQVDPTTAFRYSNEIALRLGLRRHPVLGIEVVQSRAAPK